MPLALNRVVKLEDFREPVVREAIREVFAHETKRAPEYPDGEEHRKQWEVAMAVLALRDGEVLRGDAHVLGIGAGSEATLFWLTNHVHRVYATDLYADPGAWINAAPPTMLTDPGRAWNGGWNPRRLVIQHMDACELAYEDETFDGIFSSGSIEHFGGLERIGIAMDEAYRVLKPGGTASFSTEFLVDGDPLEFADHMVMFTPELIERILVGDRDWVPTTPIEYTLTEATLATEISNHDYAAREERGESVCPHCVLRVGLNRITSVHVALRKSAQPRPLPVRPLRITAPAPPAASAAVAPPTQPSPEHSPDGVATLPRVASRRQGSTVKRAARRLARPFLSPIDGRVADINRRVEGTKATFERTFDAYSRSSAEASSYVGVELRRLQDELSGLHDEIARHSEQLTGLQDLVARYVERTQDEYYQLRLAQAAELPLERLDAPLAQLINFAAGYRGFYAQGGVWFNPPVEVSLSAGNAEAVQVSERIVEAPFAATALSRLERGARILDIGGAESTFPLSAASLGYRVTAIDPRPLPYSHPNLESHASLLEDWEAPSEPFAAAFLISTIEHVGLGAYGEPAYGSPEHGEGADVALLDRVRGLLSPEGLLVLTAPYGAREVTELERIYDEESLNKLLTGWEVLERQIVARRNPLIWEADEKVVTGARGVVMVVASPKHPG
jgi:SAM-dependent methyltransferase